MKPAASRAWPVGTRFHVNWWREGAGPPLIFTITRHTKTAVYFRAVGFDPPTDKDRRCPRRTFFADRARRRLVKAEEPTTG